MSGFINSLLKKLQGRKENISVLRTCHICDMFFYFLNFYRYIINKKEKLIQLNTSLVIYPINLEVYTILQK